MANSFTSSNHKVVGSIDATGASDSITVRGSRLVDIAVNFDGASAFTGTIALQGEYDVGASNVASWETIEAYTSSTYKVMRFAASRRVRLNCTTDSGGTALIELSAGNKE